ncbi:MAG TPA: DinB family protein [Candidatus Limnocylindria bacterium]|nr:DinB family protein [Candidatus Limnocylindria bacterium]
MREAMLEALEELLRETFEGALPGEGTQYLDHASGIRSTLDQLTAAQASRPTGHPSIASHVRHMNFHLRMVGEWIAGDHRRRDWKSSFEPRTVTEAEWSSLKQELEDSRSEFIRVMKSRDSETFAKEGAGLGAVAHLAYHLGAIRQLMHDVYNEMRLEHSGGGA